MGSAVLGWMWPASRRGRVGVLALGLGLALGVAGLLRRGPAAPIVAAVQDELGLRLVEGHGEILRTAAEESQVDVFLLGGIMYSESRGRSGQTSSAGAMGLMQLGLPAAQDAAKRLGLPAPGREEVLHDDPLNVRLAASHVAWLLEHAGDWDLEAVLVSYNAGRAKLMRWESEHGSYAAWCRSEEEAEAAGRPSTGALHYARQTLLAAEKLRERGAISP